MVDSTKPLNVQIDNIATDLNNKMDRDFVNSIGYNSSRPFEIDTSNKLVLVGYITGGRADLNFTLYLPHRIDDDVQEITVKSLKANIRSNLGSYYPKTDFVENGYELVGYSGVTVTATKIIDNIIHLHINFGTAISTSITTNNSPQTIEINKIRLEFS